MRLSEQYSCEWSQVNLQRRTIELTMTKNGSARTVRLNEKVVAAIESLRRSGQKKTDLVFPSAAKDFDTGEWFQPCLEEAGITGYLREPPVAIRRTARKHGSRRGTL
jgi:integrase